MNLIIVGGGEVGEYLAKNLRQKNHDIYLIEEDLERAEELRSTLDIQVISGNGCSVEILSSAHVFHCDCFLALTSNDTVNLLSSSLAKGLGAQRVFARIHKKTEEEDKIYNLRMHFDIDGFLNPENFCALEFTKEIRNSDRVAIESFAQGVVEIREVIIDQDSKWISRSLQDLAIPSDIRIAFVQRKDKIAIPNKDTLLYPEDRLTLVGSSKAFQELEMDLDGSHNLVSGVLWGISEFSMSLIPLLSNPKFRIKILEENEEKCIEIAQQFPHLMVVHGSVKDLTLLEEEQMGENDFFIACSRSDEENIAACLQFTKLGVEKRYLTLRQSDYEGLSQNLEHLLGLNVLPSPQQLTLEAVEHLIDSSKIKLIHSFEGDYAQILQLKVSSNSPCVGKTIRNIGLPHGVLLLVLAHKFQSKMPSPDDVLLAEDTLLVLTQEDQINELKHLFL